MGGIGSIPGLGLADSLVPVEGFRGTTSKKPKVTVSLPYKGQPVYGATEFYIEDVSKHIPKGTQSITLLIVANFIRQNKQCPLDIELPEWIKSKGPKSNEIVLKFNSVEVKKEQLPAGYTEQSCIQTKDPEEVKGATISIGLDLEGIDPAQVHIKILGPNDEVLWPEQSTKKKKQSSTLPADPHKKDQFILVS